MIKLIKSQVKLISFLLVLFLLNDLLLTTLLPLKHRLDLLGLWVSVRAGRRAEPLAVLEVSDRFEELPLARDLRSELALDLICQEVLLEAGITAEVLKKFDLLGRITLLVTGSVLAWISAMLKIL